MNILPLVLALLLLFSFLGASFFQERISSHLEESSYKGYLRAEQNGINRLVRKEYNKAKKRAQKKERSESSVRKRVRNYRESVEICNHSKLNIGALFDPGAASRSPFLYDTAAELLLMLYGEKPFFKGSGIADLEHKLLDAMIAASRTKKEVKTLADLYPQDEKLAQIFYQMLKGSKKYDLVKLKGSAPLDHFFTLDGKQKKSLSFHFASPTLLTATFGRAAAKSILEAEEKKRSSGADPFTLNESEVESLLSNNSGRPHQLSMIKHEIDFSIRFERAEGVTGEDHKTHITVLKK
jgi:hypothetical protein